MTPETWQQLKSRFHAALELAAEDRAAFLAGIAKLLSPDWSTATSAATATMLRLMTPEYASPEQLRGQSNRYDERRS
jgi:hypothetical protein